jgi:ubiquinone/menaquinone biosynthesis C-methylase UbiE
MSSYVFMKVLESAPSRYDRGMRMLSRGRIDEIYERVAALAAAPGGRVLDIGCGTGGVSRACARRGAAVVGIDLDAGMLEVARAKPPPAEGRLEFVELGAMEIEDRFPEESFDAVVSCLTFSELSADERAHVLGTARTRLRPGGRLVVADEVTPPSAGRRLWHRIARAPLAAITYALTQASTHPVAGLADAVRAAGFKDVIEERTGPGDFAIVSARRGT